MLNNTGITSQRFNDVPQILFAVEHQVSMGILVSDAAYVTENGRKIVKAGTPLDGDLNNRTTAFTKGTTKAQGILLHDVDVTNGANNGTLLIFGFVNKNRIDATTQALLTKTVLDTIPMIKVIAC